MTKKTKLYIKRTVLLIFAFLLEGILGFLLINGIANHDLAKSKIIILIIILMLLIPVALMALLFALTFKNKARRASRVKSSGIIITDAGKNIKKIDKNLSESSTSERFCMLSAIDRKRNGYGHSSYKQNVTLEEFCDNFRNYAAYRHGLYYDIEDIRRFIAGMSVSHMLILQGMSGTGKTSLAHAIGSFVDNSSTIIPVQPMWKERTDLVG